MINTDTQIGKVIHYYDKIGVAVIKVMKKPLSVGVQVKISGHDKEFIQTIQSLQIDRKAVSRVSAGKEAGMKVDQPVKAGDVLFAV